MRVHALLLGLLVLTACGPEVYFDQPQPAEKPTLSEIPAELHGRYQEPISDSPADPNAWIELRGGYFVQQGLTTLRRTRAQLLADGRFKVEGTNRVYDGAYDRWCPLEVEGDTLTFQTYARDTTFYPNDSLHIRVMGYQYLFNWYEEDATRWQVALLSRTENGGLRIVPIDHQYVPLLKTYGTVDSTMLTDSPTEVDYYRAQLTAIGWKAFVSSRLTDEPLVLERLEQ